MYKTTNATVKENYTFFENKIEFSKEKEKEKESKNIVPKQLPWRLVALSFKSICIITTIICM